ARGKNFLRTILRLAAEREQLRVVGDQFGAPTWSRSIAEATVTAMLNWQPNKSGTYHMTCAGRTSWHGFAQAILRQYQTMQTARNWPPLKASPDGIEAITTEQYPTPARRPANSVLDNTRLREAFEMEMPNWQDGLSEALQEAVTLKV
ncbi:MAG: sugar nucleotide-binding protein, partial [Methylophilaceae bacterium]